MFLPPFSTFHSLPAVGLPAWKLNIKKIREINKRGRMKLGKP